jgi:hypothetical protein
MKKSKAWWRNYHKNNRDRINANRRKRNAEKLSPLLQDMKKNDWKVEPYKRMFIEDSINLRPSDRDRIEKFYSMRKATLFRFSMTCFGFLLLTWFIQIFVESRILILFSWLFLTLQVISALIHNSVSRKLRRIYNQDIKKINELKRGENGKPRRKRSVQ